MGYYKYTEEEWHNITNANCVDVALALGYQIDEKRSDKKALHIKNNGGLYVWRDGTGWYQHSTNERGNAVDLVQRTLCCGYKPALDYINDNILKHERTYGNPRPLPKFTAQSEDTKRAGFVLPKKAPPIRVYAYLIKSRGISQEIVKAMVTEGNLYQSKNGGNCCFIGRDKDGNPAYCTQRGTGPTPYRGEITGSIKKYGFTMTGSSDKLYVFEAPIDAMSHATLVSISGKSWSADTRLAMGGCYLPALEQHLTDYPDKYREIYVCTDNDEAGETIANKIAEAFSDKYTVRRRVSFAKDWNEDLQQIRKIAKETEVLKIAMDAYYRGEDLQKVPETSQEQAE